jgi:hypothetical protein
MYLLKPALQVLTNDFVLKNIKKKPKSGISLRKMHETG